VSLGRLVSRSLRYYWRTAVVVSFALAVATAVIVGSLVIGDCVTGSIRRAALSRLGDIHWALTAPGLFREELGEGLALQAVGLILLDGAVRNAATEAVMPRVTVVGCTAELSSLYQGGAPLELSGRQAAVNQSHAPTDTLLGRREREKSARVLRLTVASVLPDEGVGGFRLSAQPGPVRNVFVQRGWLAAQLQRPRGSCGAGWRWKTTG